MSPRIGTILDATFSRTREEAQGVAERASEGLEQRGYSFETIATENGFAVRVWEPKGDGEAFRGYVVEA